MQEFVPYSLANPGKYSQITNSSQLGRELEAPQPVLDRSLEELVLELLLAENLLRFLAAADKVGHYLLRRPVGNILDGLVTILGEGCRDLV